MSSDPHKIARKRVEEKKGFYYHLIVFPLANAFLFGLNYLTSPDFFWCLIPLMGWGVGLIIHYFVVFGIPGKGRIDETWKAREIEKELRRMGYDKDQLDLDSEQELELKEFAKQPKGWNDSDLV